MDAKQFSEYQRKARLCLDADFLKLQNNLSYYKNKTAERVQNFITTEPHLFVLTKQIPKIENKYIVLDDEEKKLTLEEWAQMSDEIIISKFNERSAEAKLQIQKHVSLNRKLATLNYNWTIEMKDTKPRDNYYFFVFLDTNGFICDLSEEQILATLISKNYPGKDDSLFSQGFRHTFYNNDSNTFHIPLSKPKYLLIVADRFNGIEDGSKNILKMTISDTRLRDILIQKSPDVFKPIMAGLQTMAGLSSYFPASAPFSGMITKGLDFIGSLYEYIKGNNLHLGVVPIDNINPGQYKDYHFHTIDCVIRLNHIDHPGVAI